MEIEEIEIWIKKEELARLEKEKEKKRLQSYLGIDIL